MRYLRTPNPALPGCRISSRSLHGTKRNETGVHTAERYNARATTAQRIPLPINIRGLQAPRKLAHRPDLPGLTTLEVDDAFTSHADAMERRCVRHVVLIIDGMVQRCARLRHHRDLRRLGSSRFRVPAQL